MAQHQPHPWTVLLLGGHSAVGKTEVASQLARRYGVGLTQVDDIRLVLQRMLPSAPDLNFFLSQDIRDHAADELCRQLIAVNQIVCDALEVVVANHVATDAPLLLEGDGLLPSFAARRCFADLDVGGRVRAVFVVEADKARLDASMQLRGRGFDRFSRAEQGRWVELSWRYGQWLAAEAARYGLPVVAAQPWATLADRIHSQAIAPGT